MLNMAVEALDRAADGLAHAVLHEARAAVGLLDHRGLVGALHELVDLARHRVLDDREQLGGVDVGLAVLGQPEVERAQAALVVRGDRHRREDPADLVVGEPVGHEALARTPGDQLLRARARRHPLGGHADEAAGAALGGHRRAEQRVDLLGGDARHRRRLVLRIARGDRHLRAPRTLTLAHLRGHVLGQLLGLEAALAQHHFADDVVDDLLEARHVRALLVRAEVDEAVQLGVIELLGARRADADDLLNVRHPRARQRDLDRRGRRLHVGDSRDRRPLHRLRRVRADARRRRRPAGPQGGRARAEYRG